MYFSLKTFAASAVNNTKCCYSCSVLESTRRPLDICGWFKYTPSLYQLLSLAFRWDPAVRMTPDEALQHEWIEEVSRVCFVLFIVVQRLLFIRTVLFSLKNAKDIQAQNLVIPLVSFLMEFTNLRQLLSRI